jgi:hypothetical protein
LHWAELTEMGAQPSELGDAERPLLYRGIRQRQFCASSLLGVDSGLVEPPNVHPFVRSPTIPPFRPAHLTGRRV